MTTRSPKPTGRMSDAARERVHAELANGHDSTNPTFTFSCTSAALLLAIADGILDANELARQELANRGLDADGTWVGFDRAREIHLGAMAANHAEPEDDTAAKQAVAEIAQHVFHLDDLETHNRDALDFHEIAVWQIKEALLAAFTAGQAAAR